MPREAERRGTGATLLHGDVGDMVLGEAAHDVVYASMTLQYFGETADVLDQVLARGSSRIMGAYR